MIFHVRCRRVGGGCDSDKALGLTKMVYTDETKNNREERLKQECDERNGKS